MNVLITAGGTSETIDTVRSITNYSTGKLGSIIADKFASNGATVTYVCGENAVLPSSNNTNIIRIKSVQELAQTINNLLESQNFDCVIHSMAVSDFTPAAILTLDDIVKSLTPIIKSISNIPPPHQQSSTQKQSDEAIQETIKQAILTSGTPPTKTKLSSKTHDLILQLKPTPKIIHQIKKKQPSTTLVGFKLQTGVSESQLLQAAQDLLTQNNCDYVLANDLQNITAHAHKAILINKQGPVATANTKQEIAEAIFTAVSERHFTCKQ